MDREKYKEIVEEIGSQLIRAFIGVWNSEGHSALRRRLRAECGIDIAAIDIQIIGQTLSVSFAVAEVEEGSSGAETSKEKTETVQFSFNPEDSTRLKNLRVRLDESDLEEMEKFKRKISGPQGDEGSGRRSKRKPVARAKSSGRSPMPRKETADIINSDPRSAGQIINSIRAAARALPVRNRKALSESWSQHLITFGFPEKTTSRLPGGDDVMNDTLWLRGLQEIINQIQARFGADPGLQKEALLALEKAVRLAGEL